MIKAKPKPLAEIREMIAPYGHILIMGCATCVTICQVGGEKEVAILTSALRIAEGGRGKRISEHTPRRQCEAEFLDEAADKIKTADAVVSLACGVGMQAVAEHFPLAVVLPGVNTTFMGLAEEQGVWSERCLGCGNCIIGHTGGICPITRCAKSLFNGPCGGSVGGRCEVSSETTPCGWQLIIDKMQRLGLLHQLSEIHPPQDWSSSHSGGPRRMVKEEARLPQERTQKLLA